MKKSPTELVNLTFSSLMVALTIAGTIVFFFTDLLSDRVFGNKRYILGTVFLLYSIYRTYRMYTTLKKES